jgi:hypothetical protein
MFLYCQLHYFFDIDNNSSLVCWHQKIYLGYEFKVGISLRMQFLLLGTIIDHVRHHQNFCFDAQPQRTLGYD